MDNFFRIKANLTSPPTPVQGSKIFAEYTMKVVDPPLKFQSYNEFYSQMLLLGKDIIYFVQGELQISI